MLADIAKNQIAAPEVPFDDMLDALVFKASLGDRRAIGAVAIGLGPTLLKQAREALGPRRADEHEDLLQDLFVCLSHGKLPFVRGRDHGLEWLRSQLESLAHASPTDRLVARAVDADPDAVDQIMTEFGDMLVEEARATLGAHGWFEAEQVVKDLEEELLEGAVSCARGRRAAVGFLRQRIRAMARSRRLELEGAEELVELEKDGEDGCVEG
jgi:DNA-directed RNA polymerase specialized sigma24 family protein